MVKFWHTIIFDINHGEAFGHRSVHDVLFARGDTGRDEYCSVSGFSEACLFLLDKRAQVLTVAHHR